MILNVLLVFSLLVGIIERYILIDAILYKLPESKITYVKEQYETKNDEISVFHFDEDDCIVSEIESINASPEKQKLANTIRKELISYKIPNLDPVFVYQDSVVQLDYFRSVDLSSISIMDKQEAIRKFGCLGLNPVMTIELKEGRSMLQSPDGDIFIRQDQ